KPQLFAIAEKMSGERLATRPAQEPARNPFHEPDQRAQQDVNGPEWPGQQYAQPVGISPKKHFRQQIKKGVEEKYEQGKNDDKPKPPGAQHFVQEINRPAKDEQVGDGIADQNG